MLLNRHHKYPVSLHALIILTLSTSPALANTFADIDIGFVTDDNLTRSDYGPDKKAGSAIELFADYGKFYDLKNNWSATAAVSTQYTNHITFNKLSTFNLGLSGSVRKKLGLGAYASSIQASLSLGVNNVSDSRRSNNALDLSLSWDKRYNDNWELSAGFSLDNATATNSVFNSSGSTLFVSTDYTYNEKLLFSFGLSQRSGDIITVTNAAANPNEVTWNYLSLASGGNKTSDSIFGSGLTAYRINAKTLIIKAALSYALDDYSSVNAGIEYQDSALAYGISYKNNLIRLNYIYSF